MVAAAGDDDEGNTRAWGIAWWQLRATSDDDEGDTRAWGVAWWRLRVTMTSVNSWAWGVVVVAAGGDDDEGQHVGRENLWGECGGGEAGVLRSLTFHSPVRFASRAALAAASSAVCAGLSLVSSISGIVG